LKTLPSYGLSSSKILMGLNFKPGLSLHLTVSCLALVLFSCCGSSPSDLEHALALAGENRGELEKVLKKYSSDPADSLKYRSAVFLIENMSIYHYHEGGSVSDYHNYYHALKKSKSEPKVILDSVTAIYGRFDLKKSERKFDVETIDSAYLCETIELAVEAWQEYPWSRHYDFGTFCEYILPYRIGNEPMTNWRSVFRDEYSSILEGVNASNPIEAAKILRDSVLVRAGAPRFTMTRPAGYPTLDALTSRQMSGACDDLTQFTISLFRAFGIAVSEDRIPVRGDDNTGHSWVSLVDVNGDLYNSDFFGEIVYVSETMLNRAASKAKVFRKKFSQNRSDIEIFARHKTAIPSSIFDYVCRSTDVTKPYANNLIDLHIPRQLLYADSPRPVMAFLCAPSWLEWRPIAWGEFDKSGGMTFREVNGGTILRLAYFDKSDIRFLSSPFYVHRQSRDLVFIPDADFSNVGEVVLYSKYSTEKDQRYVDRLLNGRFEGANDPGFVRSDTLHLIRKVPTRLFTEVSIRASRKYRYLRYKGGEGSHCNIAEVEFFSDMGKLAGETIGTAGAWAGNPKYEYTSAFDGLTETSFDHATPSDGWTGLRLPRPEKVTKIRYAPRNYDNFVKKGNDYELFVSTRDGWISFGRQRAKSDSLLFSGVPLDAILYLKNHTGGMDERVFQVRNGRQVFR